MSFIIFGKFSAVTLFKNLLFVLMSFPSGILTEHIVTCFVVYPQVFYTFFMFLQFPFSFSSDLVISIVLSSSLLILSFAFLILSLCPLGEFFLLFQLMHFSVLEFLFQFNLMCSNILLIILFSFIFLNCIFLLFFKYLLVSCF